MNFSLCVQILCLLLALLGLIVRNHPFQGGFVCLFGTQGEVGCDSVGAEGDTSATTWSEKKDFSSDMTFK